MAKDADGLGAQVKAPTPAERLPDYLADRFHAWRSTRYAGDRAWYAQLAAGGQHPRAMVVACCDSRVDVPGLLGAQPGDLFMVRNVANLCPPYAPDHEHHGTSAAIEYAVTALKVAHVIVLGHANCGGVAAYLDRRDGELSGPAKSAAGSGASRFIDRWMEILAPGYERLNGAGAGAANAAEKRRQRLRALEHEAVLCSIRNLLSFPFVQSAVDEGRLTLHGAWFDIADGALYSYDPARDMFTAV